MKKTQFLLLILFSCILSAQGNKAIDSLVNSFEKYYNASREIIHVNFNKKTFYTDETIWMSGYVFLQQEKKLSSQTNNVFMEVYDENQKLLYKKLLFANNGNFRAHFDLNKNFDSGNYYIRFYTNWMNNFAEELSSTYKIEIINSSDLDYHKNNKPLYDDVFIKAIPESGVFVANKSNTVSVRLTDYKNSGLEINSVKVLDFNNNQVTSFSTNKFGYGKFDLSNTKTSQYKIIVEFKGNTFTEILPIASSSSIGISVINYSLSNKTIISLKSNIEFENNKYYLLINQNNNLTVLPINSNSKDFVLNNSDLEKGVNTVRIIDQDFNIIAERLFFNNVSTTKETINFKHNYSKELDVKVIEGVVKGSGSLLSISVLPEKTKSISDINIFNSIYVNPYVLEKSSYSSDYFTSTDRKVIYDLDLFFIHQKAKESFKDIKEKKYPTSKYTFDKGLTISGKVSQIEKNPKDYKLTIFSLPNQIHITKNLGYENDFSFENIAIQDSAWVSFTLTNKSDNDVEFGIYPKITNNNRSFLKSLQINKNRVGKFKYVENIIEPELTFIPKFDNHQQIETVNINVDRSSNLKRSRQNVMLRGIKAENEGPSQMLVVDYIASKGFNVKKSSFGTDIVISSRNASAQSINSAPPTTQIIIDDMEQFTNHQLEFLRMEDVDEIYYDRIMIIPGLRNYVGIIKIYTKNRMGMLRDYNDPKVKPYQITNGYLRNKDYQNPQYLGFDDAFNFYGTLYWNPEIITDSKGSFIFELPAFNQKTVKIQIEGITFDGKFFSEVKQLEFNN